ncbi:MAG: hypothetical protein AB1758_35400, partial [Candidatus Eremiobacterota bacterium]
MRRTPRVPGRSAPTAGSVFFRLATLLALLGCLAGRAQAAWQPESFLVYYGDWDSARVEQALDCSLVILQPGAVSASQVAALQAGRDGRRGTPDDVRVLAYVSLGEDEHVPRGLALRPDRGPVHFVTGKGLQEGGNDFPTFYLDELRQLGP